jgi:tetratricopeptide (TPR) repeat protein
MPAQASIKLSDVLQPAHRHLAAGEVDVAKALLEQGLEQWPDAGALRLLAARIAEAEGRHGDALSGFREAALALRAEAERSQDNPRVALALARALGKSGETDAAAAALAMARQRGIDPADALRTEQGLAWGRKDWDALRRASQQLIDLKTDPTAQDFVTLAIACRNLDDFDGAAAAAATALQRNPAELNAAVVAAWVAVRQGNVEAAISGYRRLAELAPANPRWPFEIVRLLVLSGSVAEGSEALDAAMTRWPGDPSLRAFALIGGFRSPDEIAPVADTEQASNIGALRERQFRQVLDGAPKGAELLRPVVVDEKASDVIVAPAPNADAAVLVFTALTDVVSMPLPLIDRYLAALGLTAIYLKDFQRLLYLRGISSLGADYSSTVKALRDLCNRLAVRRLCTLGTSSGGFAAIRYGVELGADRVLSFAGLTHSADDSLTKLEPGVAMIMRRLLLQVSSEDLDLREFLRPRQYSSKIEFFYPGEGMREREQALHVSGIGGVTLHPVAGCDDHELLRWLALRGHLSAILADALAMQPRA